MKTASKWPRGRWADCSGATAVEFALVMPAFFMLIIGGFYMAGLLYVTSSMQYAVEAGARCASVNTTICTSAATTVTYAQSHFLAAGATTPTFASSTAPCGHSVTGTVTYVLDIGLSKINVPLSASACFP